MNADRRALRAVPADPGTADGPDPLQPMAQLFRDLRSSGQRACPAGRPRGGWRCTARTSWPGGAAGAGRASWPGSSPSRSRCCWRVAAVLAWISGTPRLAIAIAAVILLNAVFAFAQEMQAERAVEALAAFLPERARVLRDGKRQEIEARLLVPGDVLLIEEGESVCADARLIAGTLEVDMSTLTGESVPVTRSAGPADASVPLLQASERGVQRHRLHRRRGRRPWSRRPGCAPSWAGSRRSASAPGRDESPLERQVRRVTWLIAFVAVGGGHRVPADRPGRRAELAAAASFAIGLLVANVPEGLLPTITLALAVGVREMARRGALVKRLSAVETLGSTSVICTDKTARSPRTGCASPPYGPPDGESAVPGRGPPARQRTIAGRRATPRARPARAAMAACNNADLNGPAASRPATRPRSRCSSWRPACGLDVSLASREAAPPRSCSASTPGSSS